MKQPIILDSKRVRVDGPNEKELVFKNFQEIPDWFLQRLRDAQELRPARHELRKVASIPEEIVNHWKRQGFDIHDKDVTAEQIIARLQREDMGAFITGTP